MIIDSINMQFMTRWTLLKEIYSHLRARDSTNFRHIAVSQSIWYCLVCLFCFVVFCFFWILHRHQSRFHHISAIVQPTRLTWITNQ